MEFLYCSVNNVDILFVLLDISFTISGSIMISQTGVVNSSVWGENVLLPPANEVWGKVICLQACVCPQGRGCLARGGPAPGGCLVLVQGVPGGDPPDGYCCGRYASHWNAFLFDKIFAKNCMKMKEIG